MTSIVWRWYFLMQKAQAVIVVIRPRKAFYYIILSSELRRSLRVQSLGVERLFWFSKAGFILVQSIRRSQIWMLIIILVETPSAILSSLLMPYILMLRYGIVTSASESHVAFRIGNNYIFTSKHYDIPIWEVWGVVKSIHRSPYKWKLCYNPCASLVS